MKIKQIIPAAIIVFLLAAANIKAQTITLVQQTKATSIRGLSVVDENIAWVSGSRGTIGTTNDGGKTWAWQQIKGYEKSDFRDIEAFNDKEAIIMSSGTPALVLKTTDGGKSWQEKCRKTDSIYFFDAMAFSDKQHGWILGDPIAGKLLLLKTSNGGETWEEIKDAPSALANEASFAASGTCLRADGSITIVTGGGNSRILSSPISKIAWTATLLPLTNGKPSQGAFSFAKGKNQIIIVGGDYAKDIKSDSVAYIIPQPGASSKGNIPAFGPAGFQSSVEYIDAETFLATGTPGSNITTNGGKTWHKIDGISYNVCRKAKHGKLILLAGDGGKVGIYNP